ncbi:hypothetical protein IV04_24595 [Serratia sp. Ag1]|nr:hypothetical protein JV45_25000 [Serratia sp. Ag2]KFK92590.1 hypothetical protein IV04_24595 [Serratia sp. Ag1]
MLSTLRADFSPEVRLVTQDAKVKLNARPTQPDGTHCRLRRRGARPVFHQTIAAIPRALNIHTFQVMFKVPPFGMRHVQDKAIMAVVTVIMGNVARGQRVSLDTLSVGITIFAKLFKLHDVDPYRLQGL